jgi:hypothetical protein
MLRSLALLLLTALVPLPLPAQPAPAQPPQAAPVEPGAVSGWVVNTATGKPVVRAAVILVPSGAGTNLTAVTDAGGQFAFSAVEPGNYTIGAVRAGFAVLEAPGVQDPAGRVGIMVASGAKVTGLKLRLTPEAVIAGRVTDTDGDPQPGVSVRLMHPVYMNGQRQLQRIEQIIRITDDRGEYRIYGLVPGRYAVFLAGGNYGAAFDKYFPAFYPSGDDASAATLFDVKAGTQLHDINLVLLTAQMTKLRGHAIDASTDKPVSGASILIGPKGSAFNSVGLAASSNAKGEWQISDLRTGLYIVGAELSRGQERLSARVTLDLPANGVDDLQLRLTPGAELAGTVRLESEQGRAGFDPSKLRVVLQPREPGALTSNGAVAANGGFTVRSVRPAPYDVSVTPLPEALYLKSVLLEKEETINTGFEVAESRSYRLDVTLGGDGAQLEGTVKDSDDAPASGVTVLLVPAGAALRKSGRLYKTATTTHDGKYVLKGIPAGGYLLFAWDQVDPGIWFEPDFLPRYEAQAVSVSLEANGRTTTGLKLLTTVEAPAR